MLSGESGSSPLPLSALLSRALVAFIIEFDNEFERQAPHRTTNHGSTGSAPVPWLVSMPMWSLWLRFVPDSGISIKDWQTLSGAEPKEARLWLTRLSKWWGYLEVRPDRTIHPTPGGLCAFSVWRTLTPII